MSLTPKQEKCARHILSNLPGFILNPDFRSVIGLKNVLLIDKPSDPMRGWAQIDGQIFINAAHLSRHCSDSPYSKFGGKADLSPTGVIAHEVGHIVHFALKGLRRDPDAVALNNRARELYTTDRKHGITSYARTHWHEDFAEAHRLWCTNPDRLKELSESRWELHREIYRLLLGTDRKELRIKKSKRSSYFLELIHAEES